MSALETLITALKKPENSLLLNGILRGIEKEGLRIDLQGGLALSPHPKALGSALTHPKITTDFSEALLEFITPPSHRAEKVLASLKEVHQFTYQSLNNERIWPGSMPCVLGDDSQIPVAQYGTSNVGRMKTVYRLGLGQRYGRKMQTIAGIHYNFSLPSPFWAYLHTKSGSKLDLQRYKTERYFDLIRNFRRYYWLLVYLFGASPAVCKTFINGQTHQLTQWDGEGNTLYAPYGTSLRMGDLGYQSNAQKSLVVDYNHIENYLKTLCSAINTEYPDYSKMGHTGEDGLRHQLNSNLLQIENEFYSPIRPKRTARSGETALTALHYRGVEYIEVRCLDLNPFEPLGISSAQIRFLDTFLLYCLLENSPQSTADEYHFIQENQKRIVYEGRNPELSLLTSNGDKGTVEWGEELMEKMGPVAELLDHALETNCHTHALSKEKTKLRDPELTPSARILAEMKEQKIGYYELMMKYASQHHDTLSKDPLTPEQTQQFKEMADQSLQDQLEIENNETKSFEEHLKSYYDQYHFCKG
ncbi:glutamate--cysteine ligase [Marinibactrum halimedae]|uniref:Glutamate--cysteine ligase n=1 Tax=Marinibactrum halimedae TaxID=1444977 RepID=A0AA37WN50_9GAMM|nr:glutamate--cysteine ligase [Marinibactrum halimedae]MCD9458250.1 glutamate--cysteine ligase [Marinibactrum halimedae]GLS27123.1 glutamate--cysteine ligase [Marinibactrum halimedae]